MFWVVIWARAFRGSFFWSFFGVRSLGSFFGFVLFGRSSRGSCFWVRSLGSSFGGSCVFFFDAYKVLEGVCGKVRGFLCKDSKKFATMQIYTLKIFCSPFGFSVNRVVKAITTGGYGCLCGARKCFSCFAFYIESAIRLRRVPLRAPQNVRLYTGKDRQLPCVNVVIMVISH